MESMFIVCEVNNNYILGVYTSELNAIKGIFNAIEEDDDGEATTEYIMKYDVGNDFKIFAIPINHPIELSAYIDDSKAKDSMRAGYELPQKKYSDMLERQRELSISEIVD